jgi:hypothetical protein
MSYQHAGGQFQTTVNFEGKPLNPLPFQLSTAKLKAFVPELTGFSGCIHQLFVRLGKQQDDLGNIRACLSSGEPAPAIVLSVAPLRVAVRATALDCATVLDFPTELVPIHGLRPGSRLLSVNNYVYAGFSDTELTPGPKRNPRWTHVLPVVADFLCDETDAIQRYKALISDAEWHALFHAGQRIMAESMGARYKDGRPHLAGQSRTESMAYLENHRSAQRARKILLSVLAAIILIPTLLCGGIGTMMRRQNTPPTLAQAKAQAEAQVQAALSSRPSAQPSVRAPAIPTAPGFPTQPDFPPTPPNPPPPKANEMPYIELDHPDATPEMKERFRQAQEFHRESMNELMEFHRNGSGKLGGSRDGDPVTRETLLQPGDKVYALWGSSWWDAKIVRADVDTATISYDGWTGTEVISRSKLRIPRKTSETKRPR